MERPILRSIAVSCALAALAGVSAPLDAQDARTAAVREILTLQDQRSVLDGKLVEYLSSPQAELRRRACLALANIQDTTTVPSIIPLLADGSWRVRQAAAYALGQIRSERVWVSLASRLNKERHAEVIARLLEALGKCADADGLDRVLAYRVAKDQASLKADQALALARFALRGVRSKQSIEFATRLLDDESSAVQWTALYALWRSAPDSSLARALSQKSSRLKALARSKNPDVRRTLAMLCGRVQGRSARSVLKELATAEPWPGNWRVRTQLVRSLAAHVSVDPSFVGVLSTHLTHRSANVRLATLSALTGLEAKALGRSSATKALAERLARLGSSEREIPSHRAEAIKAFARLFPEQYRFDRLLDDAATPAQVSAGVLQSLANLPSRKHMGIVLKHLDDRSLPVAMAAWETMPAVVAWSVKEPDAELSDVASRVAHSIKSSLLRSDMALTTLVAQAVADSVLIGVLNAEGLLTQVTEDLMLAYAELSSPDDVEAMQSVVLTLGLIGDVKAIPVLERALGDPDRTVAVRAAAALQQVTGRDYSLQVPASSEPLATDYDWTTLESIPAAQKVVLVTTKGTITLELMAQEAPFTVMSFVKLVRKHFYDGLSFHRVVPDFVVQGGDPRGDGWGGPGYSIRTEVGLERYNRGMVGIASAGKDTEGCQFFITHSSQPHLDGRYTIFGRVVKGMEVVDAIQIGDSITSVTLKN